MSRSKGLVGKFVIPLGNFSPGDKCIARKKKPTIHHSKERFDLCPPSRYLNAIQTMCPHILRYLTTAVITNKDVRKRRQVLKDLVKVIQQVPHPLFVHYVFSQLIGVWK